MKRILTYRFSAFGDVAMTAPVIREFLEQNPETEVIMVSRNRFAAIYEGIERLHFYGVDLDRYQGLWGMWKLQNELIRKFHPDFIADLHDVLRTKMLDTFTTVRGIRLGKINKGKAEKKALTNVRNLDKKQLEPTVERYADVFRNLGFQVKLSHKLRPQEGEKAGIGFAPFAQHYGKMLPLEKSREVVEQLSAKYPIYFFGGGKKEVETLAQWEKEFPNTTSLAGKLSLKEELEKIAGLRLLISMDSANMHLASLVGTRVVSVWGATHPYAGFLGYGQSYEDVVQVEDLSCRPCSVFGQKKCFRGDWACLHELQVSWIVEKVEKIMESKNN